MKSLRFFVLSTTSALGCVALAGCGEGGGFRGATIQSHGGGTLGAGAGGASSGDAGVGGLSAGSVAGGQAGDAGAGLGAADSGSAGAGGTGFAGESGSGHAGSAGSAAGMSSAGGAAGNGTSGAGGASGGGRGGMSSGGAANGGTGGAAGTSTAGTAGTGGPLTTCAERCNADADCRIFSVDSGYRCNTSTHRCTRFADPCRNSGECLPEASLWTFACGSDADCFFFTDERCVDVGGVGRCARLAPSATGCTGTNADEVTLPLFGAAGSVLVCGNASLTCSDGECVPGCTSSADCSPARNGSVCDTSARLCRCTGDEDCGGAGVSHCNMATGRCECSTASDCDEVPNANACQAGRCGCNGVAACNAERTFSGTSYVCE